MVSLLDPAAVDDYGRPIGDPGSGSGLLGSIGDFLSDQGTQITDANLRAAGLDPDVVRLHQALLADRPEARLPALPAAPGAGDSDPYMPTMPDPNAQIARANLDAAGNLGVQLGSTFEGGLKMGTKAGNIVRVDVRGPNNELVDAKPMTARAVGAMLDAHLDDPSSVALYGGRGAGGDGSDITVTLPASVGRAQDLATQGQRMVDEAGGQPGARTWYSGGAEAMYGMTGQDLPATERLAAAHAITSPQTDVAGNTNLAVNAWNQSLLGDPIQVKTAPQNTALEGVLYGDAVPESRKVGPFFQNHMRYLDPSVGDNLTNDIWQMRQAGFTGPGGAPYSGTPSVGEDNYVRMAVGSATRQLNAQGIDGGGWTPDQVQAALWVHQKNATQGGGGTTGLFNFKNGLDRLTAAQSNAHQAGDALLGDAAGDASAQSDFHEAASPLLTDPLGRDVVNSSLGMLTPPGIPGAAALAQTADGVKPSSRTLMDASSLIRATLLRQPDALWVAHSDVTGAPTYANANVAHVLSGDPANAADALRVALDRAGGGLENTVLQPSPAGVRALNVGQLTGMDNPSFQAAVRDAMQRAGLSADVQRARADYGYFSHDWTADPTGAGYVQQLAQLPPHVQRIGDQLFANLGGPLDAAAARLSGGGTGAGGLPGGSGPWRVPGFAQAVGPDQPLLPVRPWVRRPSPNDPSSALLSLLRGNYAPPSGAGLLGP